jgi:hypothetical protein
MAKPQMLPPALLNEVQQRLRLVPMLRAALEHDAAFELSIGSPHLHERDGRGRNWNITGFRSGFVFWPQCQEEFRLIVDRLRERYDMA